MDTTYKIGVTPKAFLVQCQGLRALAFLCILASHLFKVGALGAWGVSVFLVLSGFLMTYNYLGRNDVHAFGARFAFGKIKRLYGLHVLILVGCVIAEITVGADLTELAIKALLHLGMVQAWVPRMDYYYSLNDVSWYLSVCVFAYACFGPVIRHLRRMRSRRRITAYLVGLIVLELGVAMLAGQFGNADPTKPWSMHWMTYVFPASRFLDFLAGCCLGWLYLRANAKWRTKHLYVLDAAAACLTGISWLVYARSIWPLGSQNLKYSFLFLIPSLVLLFAVTHDGFISRVLQSKVLVWIGNISAYGFLVHGVIIACTEHLLNSMGIVGDTVLAAVCAVLATFAAAALWQRMVACVHSVKQKS